ncbi:MAG: isoprenylcysteine carboxylmethyltransferase family protein [Bacteroidota bacterium]
MKGTAYLLQATLISLWWIGLLLNQEFYEAFQFPGIGSNAFNSFMLPDLIVVALLSIVRAYKKRKELDYVILGGFGFATLYCVNASILTGGGFLSTTVMILGLCYNLFLISGQQAFRKATTDNMLANSIKTIFQIVCVWLITLFVFPVLIIESFEINSLPSKETISMAISLFVFFSTIGLYSAYVMVKIGQGTPLPLDQTQKLVTKGPYKYVRNPMAIAGIGQGLSVSILFWSIHILIYTMIGAILWQFVVRPLEERDMIERFGEDYLEYKSRVKCWIPKIN